MGNSKLSPHEKITELAEKLVWTGGPYAAEKERIAGILREELKPLLKFCSHGLA